MQTAAILSTSLVFTIVTAAHGGMCTCQSSPNGPVAHFDVGCTDSNDVCRSRCMADGANYSILHADPSCPTSGFFSCNSRARPSVDNKTVFGVGGSVASPHQSHFTGWEKEKSTTMCTPPVPFLVNSSSCDLQMITVKICVP